MIYRKESLAGIATNIITCSQCKAQAPFAYTLSKWVGCDNCGNLLCESCARKIRHNKISFCCEGCWEENVAEQL